MGIFNFSDKKKGLAFDLSWRAILKFALALFLFYIVYLVRDILLWVLFGLVISVLFDPAIDFLQKFKVSRVAAVFLVYFSVLGFFGFLIYSVAPVVASEVVQFSAAFPGYFDKFSPTLTGMGFDSFQNVGVFTDSLTSWLVSASASVFSSVASIFGGLFLTITVFTIAVFISLEEKGIENLIRLVMPKRREEKMIDLWHRSQAKISGWFAARFFTMIIVGILTALACFAMGMKYPIFFGFLAALLDIIPFIGPLIAGVIITAFALLQSWHTAVFIAVTILVIQQIEGNILTPILAKKFLEFPAILVLLSILVGERLWGPAGAILAMPIFGILFDFTREYLEKNKD